ncbi:8-oxo-dGTP diphosphatase MutT [Cocleimonas sp. KMM 6892]|uniref:8-oxo-dGTP diphosphatase MutT n=1 Tax=unclassified Cocleimonas TaxID=2639732 RepID=UPI002DBF5918|nr:MULTISPECIES: 8-oxo-dGTP diphosphatase MutT [unclassified Cocleimonas]MEB8433693.1 8-oxo-dGTP diphosphatase MutT [Cocleimonas sp. KMM 6892]MEC4716504.1 8-oxo-dGTP diphosphatase MutT [Cocleimonas sp. KMM 6895]MEC4745603.1 8-oxo-dGTP diphosphatase MutT [Cocleimonas sp. KMM 6896]
MIIRVAVAVIINQDKEVLIAKRSKDQHQGNKWEFPGGKVEANETSQEALHREIMEELGIDIQSSSEMTSITHEYIEENPDNSKTVILDVFDVRDWRGEPKGVEGQPIRWVTVSEIDDYEFPIANVEIVNIIKHL